MAMPYLIQCFGLLMGAMMPCVRATIASLVDSDALQNGSPMAVSLGAIAALTSLVSIVAPVASPIYAATDKSCPDLIYYIGAGLTGISSWVAWTLPNLEELHVGESVGEDPESQTSVVLDGRVEGVVEGVDASLTSMLRLSLLGDGDGGGSTETTRVDERMSAAETRRDDALLVRCQYQPGTVN